MARLSDEALEKVFSRLKPYCVDLLRNLKKSPSFLRNMADFLRQAPPEALQPSVDYTMFPLLLLLDASVLCRSGDKGGDLGGGRWSGDCRFGSGRRADVPRGAAQKMPPWVRQSDCRSSNLRKEALLTHRVLLAKIGTAYALAFFLPGIVSRFAKALHVSKGIITGAAGNTGSIEHAVRGLTEFLIIVLSDEVNLHGLELSMDGSTVLPPNKSESTVSVLEALRQLPVNAGYRSENSEHSSTEQAVAVVSCNKVVDEKNDAYPVGNRTLYVHRTKEWIDRTSEQVDKLLSATFPHLSTHPAEKVRKGLVDGIRGLLTNCYYTLKRSKLMLLLKAGRFLEFLGLSFSHNSQFAGSLRNSFHQNHSQLDTCSLLPS